MSEQQEIQKALEMKKLYEDRMSMIQKMTARKAQLESISDKATQAKSDFAKVVEYMEEMAEILKK